MRLIPCTIVLTLASSCPVIAQKWEIGGLGGLWMESEFHHFEFHDLQSDPLRVGLDFRHAQRSESSLPRILTTIGEARSDGCTSGVARRSSRTASRLP